MPQKNYHLHLKGVVGGYDFDSSYVDFILGKHKDEQVNVLSLPFRQQALFVGATVSARTKITDTIVTLIFNNTSSERSHVARRSRTVRVTFSECC